MPRVPPKRRGKHVRFTPSTKKTSCETKANQHRHRKWLQKRCSEDRLIRHYLSILMQFHDPKEWDYIVGRTLRQSKNLHADCKNCDKVKLKMIQKLVQKSVKFAVRKGIMHKSGRWYSYSKRYPKIHSIPICPVHHTISKEKISHSPDQDNKPDPPPPDQTEPAKEPSNSCVCYMSSSKTSIVDTKATKENNSAYLLDYWNEKTRFPCKKKGNGTNKRSISTVSDIFGRSLVGENVVVGDVLVDKMKFGRSSSKNYESCNICRKCISKFSEMDSGLSFGDTESSDDDQMTCKTNSIVNTKCE